MFPIISVADGGLGEMCFPAGLHYPFILLLEKFAYMAILRHPFSEKFAQRHIDFYDISDILVGKVNK